MYTAREELRGKKLRNRKEFAFEGGIWRTVVEEGGWCWRRGPRGRFILLIWWGWWDVAPFVVVAWMLSMLRGGWCRTDCGDFKQK